MLGFTVSASRTAEWLYDDSDCQLSPASKVIPDPVSLSLEEMQYPSRVCCVPTHTVQSYKSNKIKALPSPSPTLDRIHGKASESNNTEYPYSAMMMMMHDAF